MRSLPDQGLLDLDLPEESKILKLISMGEKDTDPGAALIRYDTSYYRGKRYTVLLGLRDTSSSRLVCHLYTKLNSREKRILEIETGPGTLVVFNGDRLWHSVSPTREGEQRFVVTMEYVTSASMNPFLRFVSNMKDAIAYFGFREVVLRRLRSHSHRKR